HSSNGTEWESIDKIDGAGNSSSLLSYQAVHQNPRLGINYYKLRQTDFNGTYTHSEITSVNFTEDATLIYPNPANDIINISKPNVVDYDIKLINTLGQEIKVIVDAYDNILQVNTSNLPEGIYLVILSNGVTQETYRINIHH